MGSYWLNLVTNVVEASEANFWDAAVDEWEIADCVEDEKHKASCICGKEKLRFVFTIRNRYNGNELYPIGSKCIEKFGRRDLNDYTSINEALFELLHALRNRERIELNSNFFTRKLLKYLYDDGAFLPSAYNGHDGYNDYQFMLDMFNQRTEPSFNQQKKINAIILNSIRPYLERILADKIL